MKGTKLATYALLFTLGAGAGGYLASFNQPTNPKNQTPPVKLSELEITLQKPGDAWRHFDKIAQLLGKDPRDIMTESEQLSKQAGVYRDGQSPGEYRAGDLMRVAAPDGYPCNAPYCRNVSKK